MTAGRQWLITARDRRCFDCGEAVKPTLNPDGRITSVCSCGRHAERQADTYYEQRACEQCHYTRRVTVGVYQNGGEHASKLCDACTLDQSAATHLYTAKKLHAKAQAIRAKRTQRSEP